MIFGLDPPHKPPFRRPDKKSTNLLLFQIGIRVHTHQDLYWSVAELWDKNWDPDALAFVTYQAPITGLHSPTLLPFLETSTDYFMLAQSCKLWVNFSFIGLTHPAACNGARVPLTFGHVHNPPPFPQFAQIGCQSTRRSRSWEFYWYI